MVIMGHDCGNCFLRKRYDRSPLSLTGRLWRWHVGWCPMWKSYLGALSAEERQRLISKYNLAR